ncbi:hypothetical protein HMPREF9153_0828 [Cutibacterium avidum ATCC 25577]|uniref:Uncharacterized protein n=1 Tax=Cutibacterium avidum ATCC 25577 TaxID=997355 RepID=G4CWC1_9ACTN|nr:hypothetical protein HMPREF9153_0828 [Cutibacterium avidum ATCC 25577]
MTVPLGFGGQALAELAGFLGVGDPRRSEASRGVAGRRGGAGATA